MEIISKQKNLLLNREEIQLQVESKITVPRKELIERIASEFKAKKELIVVDKIHSNFGEQKTNASVKIYEDEKTLKQIEPEYKKLKQIGEKKSKKSKKEQEK